MKCLECQSTQNKFDEVLGELVCEECGLVLVTEPFEQGTYLQDNQGSIIRERWSSNLHEMGLQTIKPKSLTFTQIENKAVYKGVSMCRLLMASLKIPRTSTIFTTVEELYLILYRKHTFSTAPLEDRAAALVYYCLKNESLPFTLKEVCAEYECNKKSVFRLSRKIAKEENNTGVFLIKECRPFAEKYAMLLANELTHYPSYLGKVSQLSIYFDNILSKSNENIKPSTPAAYCSIVATMENMNITNKKIQSVSGIGHGAIGREVKRLLKIINANKKQIKGKGIECLEKY
jgi:transcription initiation factor TFIIIB Brf1 subunit/transcription initiation factor TFIIB